MHIKFGTDGWRGIIADDYTYENVRLVAHAIARYALAKDGENAKMVVGYDTRFSSDRFAAECACVLASYGIETLLSDSCCPSPALSWAAKDLNATGGIMITASHNPAAYNGLKFKAPYGGSATPDIVAQIEKYLPVAQKEMTEKNIPALQQVLDQGLVKYFAVRENHLRHIRCMIDWDKLKQISKPVMFDMMHGAGLGYMQELWPEAVEVRGERNPSFGGVNPEPIGKNLQVLMDMVKVNNAVVGLATDGDADRIGAVDCDGTFINAQQCFALLLKHLVENRGWRGSVVKTVTVSIMVEKLAKRYGLEVETTPVGFKYIADRMLASDVLIGGEESGGIGFKNYIPERDGVLCGLLLAELIATTGKTLGQLWREMTETFGACHFERVDSHISETAKQQLFSVVNAACNEFAGKKVKSVDDTDGVKLIFDDCWLMFRASGTEPIVRIYCEGVDEAQVKGLLDEAVRLVEG